MRLPFTCSWSSLAAHGRGDRPWCMVQLQAGSCRRPSLGCVSSRLSSFRTLPDHAYSVSVAHAPALACRSAGPDACEVRRLLQWCVAAAVGKRGPACSFRVAAFSTHPCVPGRALRCSVGGLGADATMMHWQTCWQHGPQLCCSRFMPAEHWAGFHLAVGCEVSACCERHVAVGAITAGEGAQLLVITALLCTTPLASQEFGLQASCWV